MRVEVMSTIGTFFLEVIAVTREGLGLPVGRDGIGRLQGASEHVQGMRRAWA